MQDLSLHFFDIIENSAKAGATLVCLSLTWQETWLYFIFEDNGPGFPQEIIDNPADPYFTTRKERPVGLGLALLNESAECSGGGIEINNSLKHKGAKVTGRIDMAHLDARPLGAIGNTVLSSLLAWPELDLRVICGPEASPELILDTAEIKRELDHNDLSHPRIVHFLRENLDEGFRQLHQWMDNIYDNIRT